jgi:hypothetical protein
MSFECVPCAAARGAGHWSAVVAPNETHCRDCHRTFRRHEHHCVRCHETFGGAAGSRRHDLDELGSGCREPLSVGLVRNERGVWAKSLPEGTFAGTAEAI